MSVALVHMQDGRQERQRRKQRRSALFAAISPLLFLLLLLLFTCCLLAPTTPVAANVTHDNALTPARFGELIAWLDNERQRSAQTPLQEERFEAVSQIALLLDSQPASVKSAGGADGRVFSDELRHYTFVDAHGHVEIADDDDDSDGDGDDDDAEDDDDDDAAEDDDTEGDDDDDDDDEDGEEDDDDEEEDDDDDDNDDDDNEASEDGDGADDDGNIDDVGEEDVASPAAGLRVVFITGIFGVPTFAYETSSKLFVAQRARR
jgi:hypothetical protein